MEAVEQLRIEVKKYIDRADEKVVRMVHAMLEANADENWWDEMPDDVKAHGGEIKVETKEGDLPVF